MAKKQPFTLIYAPVVHEHLAAIDAKYDTLIRAKAEEQLSHEPDVPPVTASAFGRRPPFRPSGNSGSALATAFESSIRSTTRVGRCGSAPSGSKSGIASK